MHIGFYESIDHILLNYVAPCTAASPHRRWLSWSVVVDGHGRSSGMVGGHGCRSSVVGVGHWSWPFVVGCGHSLLVVDVRHWLWVLVVVVTAGHRSWPLVVSHCQPSLLVIVVVGYHHDCERFLLDCQRTDSDNENNKCPSQGKRDPLATCRLVRL